MLLLGSHVLFFSATFLTSSQIPFQSLSFKGRSQGSAVLFQFQESHKIQARRKTAGKCKCSIKTRREGFKGRKENEEKQPDDYASTPRELSAPHTTSWGGRVTGGGTADSETGAEQSKDQITSKATQGARTAWKAPQGTWRGYEGKASAGCSEVQSKMASRSQEQLII